MGSIWSKCKKTNEVVNGNLLKVIKHKHAYDYDLIVIGGGSGGIAAAKGAASAQQNVLLCNFVTPSPLGSTWGFGGTCTNVGCVPKKLLHAAALNGDHMRMSSAYGYTSTKSIIKTSTGMLNGEFEHNWVQLIENVQDHIQSLNWKLRVLCNTKEIKYKNAFATFQDPHTVNLNTVESEEERVTGNHIILAIGGRPKYLDIPGGRKEDAFCISSDDLFSLPYPPGKVLIVGASYIALECAGFLISLNFEVTVLVRSILLRGFDQDMANKIRLHLQTLGVLFFMEFEVTEIKMLENGTPPKFEITAKSISKNKDNASTPNHKKIYNTILLAIGREPSTSNLNLEAANVKLSSETRKIIVNDADQTSQKNIYAVGDCAEGRRELAPLAIQSGKLLALRLYRGSKILTEYNDVPTTIFTPLEYGCIGLAEEDAISKYKESDVEIYHTLFQPIEFTLPHILPTTCYLKLVCIKSLKEEVVGLHYFGPNAGEVIQGFSLGFKFKATKADYDRIVGIHPTCAERFTTLYVKKEPSGNQELVENC